MPRLIHTPEMATLATEWANNQSAGGLGWYQPNTPIAGQYNVGKEAPLSAEVIDLHELDIFNRWDECTRRAFPSTCPVTENQTATSPPKSGQGHGSLALAVPLFPISRARKTSSG